MSSNAQFVNVCCRSRAPHDISLRLRINPAGDFLCPDAGRLPGLTTSSNDYYDGKHVSIDRDAPGGGGWNDNQQPSGD